MHESVKGAHRGLYFLGIFLLAALAALTAGTKPALAQDPLPIEGCKDPVALNYNADANSGDDEELCVYLIVSADAGMCGEVTFSVQNPQGSGVDLDPLSFQLSGPIGVIGGPMALAEGASWMHTVTEAVPGGLYTLTLTYGSQEFTASATAVGCPLQLSADTSICGQVSFTMYNPVDNGAAFSLSVALIGPIGSTGGPAVLAEGQTVTHTVEDALPGGVYTLNLWLPGSPQDSPDFSISATATSCLPELSASTDICGQVSFSLYNPLGSGVTMDPLYFAVVGPIGASGGISLLAEGDTWTHTETNALPGGTYTLELRIGSPGGDPDFSISATATSCLPQLNADTGVCEQVSFSIYNPLGNGDLDPFYYAVAGPIGASGGISLLPEGETWTHTETNALPGGTYTLSVRIGSPGGDPDFSISATATDCSQDEDPREEVAAQTLGSAGGSGVSGVLIPVTGFDAAGQAAFLASMAANVSFGSLGAGLLLHGLSLRKKNKKDK